MRPPYNPAELVAGIVHIGCGAFHRAHQAVYTELALAAAPGPWGIIGASLRQPQVRNQLLAQNCLYTVLEKGSDGSRATVIGCLRDVVFTPEDTTRLPYLIAQPNIKLVSLTVTEKGYCRDLLTGALDFSHPDIKHDVAHPMVPLSTVGVLVAGLRSRRLGHGQPITILCCDNLPDNGRVLKELVMAFAERVDPKTAEWIVGHVTFPGTMADRIVPAATDATLAEARALLGFQDKAAIWSEPFRQWVIEDNFAAGRPQWEAGGAQFVDDVAPYEAMKLRLLNGSQTLMAYLGWLAGYEFINQVIAEPAFATLVRRYMVEEAAPTLSIPAGVDLAAYQEQLLGRFSNPYLPHRCDQIAIDGSQKLPQRLLGTVRDNLTKGGSIQFAALGIAAWMQYVGGVDENGMPIAVEDPLAAQLQAAASVDAESAVDGLLKLAPVFGTDLAGNAVLRTALVMALTSLRTAGSLRTVAAWAGTGIGIAETKSQDGIQSAVPGAIPGAILTGDGGDSAATAMV